jgi:hypothetical protein
LPEAKKAPRFVEQVSCCSSLNWQVDDWTSCKYFLTRAGRMWQEVSYRRNVANTLSQNDPPDVVHKLQHVILTYRYLRSLNAC